MRRVIGVVRVVWVRRMLRMRRVVWVRRVVCVRRVLRVGRVRIPEDDRQRRHRRKGW